jgi:hypothetical protein
MVLTAFSDALIAGRSEIFIASDSHRFTQMKAV